MKGKYYLIKKDRDTFICSHNMKIVSKRFDIPYTTLQREIAAHGKYIGKFGTSVFLWECEDDLISLKKVRWFLDNKLY